MIRGVFTKQLVHLVLLMIACPAVALQLASNPVNGEQRMAIQNQLQKFKAKYPQVKLTHKGYDHEYYKENIESWLTRESSHQIYFWFGGDRLRNFAKEGLLGDLSTIWNTNQLHQKFPTAAIGNIKVNNKAYALPLYYYQWGIYYRKSFFRELGLKPPHTWEEFLSLCAQLKSKNIVPIALGNEGHWPAAGWFDYLNLRINGREHHLKLLSGEISFKAPSVVEVFHTWQSLLEKGYFLPNTDNISWKEAIPYLYHNRAAMVLMGNFFLSNTPEPFRDDFAFFQFPQIKANVPTAETAPMDVLIVAKGQELDPEVSLFINFMASANVQAELASDMNMIPTNHYAPLDPQSLIAAGSEMLNRADGLTQFFDRDSKPEFSKVAMSILAKFVSGKKGIDKTIGALETARIELLVD